MTCPTALGHGKAEARKHVSIYNRAAEEELSRTLAFPLTKKKAIRPIGPTEQSPRGWKGAGRGDFLSTYKFWGNMFDP